MNLLRFFIGRLIGCRHSHIRSLYLFNVCSINSRGEIIGLALDTQGNFQEFGNSEQRGGGSDRAVRGGEPN